MTSDIGIETTGEPVAEYSVELEANLTAIDVSFDHGVSEFARELESVTDLDGFVNRSQDWFGLGSGNAWADAIGGGAGGSSSIRDPFSDGYIAGGEQDDAGSHLRPNVASLFEDPSAVAGHRTSYEAPDGTVTHKDVDGKNVTVTVLHPNGNAEQRSVGGTSDGGSQQITTRYDSATGRTTVTGFHRNKDGQLDGYFRYSRNGSSLTYQSSWDGREGANMAGNSALVQQYHYDGGGGIHSSQGTTPVPMEALERASRRGLTELRDPDSGDDSGWTPPWVNVPGNSDFVDRVFHAFPADDSESLGTNKEVAMVIDPEVTLINPDPDSGYNTSRELDSQATPAGWNPHDEAFPPQQP